MLKCSRTCSSPTSLDHWFISIAQGLNSSSLRCTFLPYCRRYDFHLKTKGHKKTCLDLWVCACIIIKSHKLLHTRPPAPSKHSATICQCGDRKRIPLTQTQMTNHRAKQIILFLLIESLDEFVSCFLVNLYQSEQFIQSHDVQTCFLLGSQMFRQTEPVARKVYSGYRLLCGLMDYRPIESKTENPWALTGKTNKNPAEDRRRDRNKLAVEKWKLG